MKKQLGLYVHIPFCIRKCLYCDFISGPGKEDEKKEYVRMLCDEIKRYASYKEEYRVVSIFFGGGTPSSIDPLDLIFILSTLCDTFEISEEERKKIEITIEANPGTLTEEKLSIYKEAGINRISMGLQSADDEELKLLGRIHTYQEFLDNYTMARKAGFANINIDLMSALPSQTSSRYKETLEKIVKLNPEHISAYSLIIEEGTPFYEVYGMDKEKEDMLPSEEEDRNMYHMTKKMLREYGYERYEISNYAKPGKECLHNSLYWNGTAYLGFGVGASSYIKGIRYQNEPDKKEYIKRILNGQDCRVEVETLTKEEQMEEFMFLGLRLTKGISKKKFEEKFFVPVESIYGTVLEKHKKERLLIIEDDNIRLSEEGLDVSNYVMSDFILS